MEFTILVTHNTTVLILILFIFSSFSCNDKSTSKPRTIIIDPSLVREIKNSEFISDYSFLSLKTDSLNNIGNIDHLIYHDKKYFILDIDHAKGVFVFSEKGEFLYSLKNKGNGPGEFISPYYFDIISEDEEIFIFDPGNRKLIFYDLKHGHFKYEKKIGFNPDKIRRLGNTFVLIMDNEFTRENKRLLILDEELNIIDDYLEIDERLLNFNVELPNNVSFYQDTLFFTLANEYSVFAITENLDFDTFLNIDTKNYTLPDNFFVKNLPTIERYKRSVNSVNYISSFIRTNDFSFLTYRYEGVNHYSYFGNDGKRIDMNYNTVIDDMGTGPTSRWPIAHEGNSLIWFYNKSDLNSFLSSKEESLDSNAWIEFKNRYQNLINFSSSLSSEADQYLIITKIEL